MSVLNIRQLHFSYGKEATLKDLNLSVPEGSIYGFLGANGAGKSTTIRNILGLLQPSAGEITIFGQVLQQAQPTIFRRVGALIESPSLYPNLSAPDHLRLACDYHGVSTQNNPALLEKVGLSIHHKKKVKQFSTGMKQRLGLAMALVHNPALLILDEPTNGLDPNGITEIRTIITQLKEEGKTILLSSHLLTEIEKIATHVGILRDGSLLFEGTPAELTAQKAAHPIVDIHCSNPPLALSVLADYTIIPMDSSVIRVQLDHQQAIPVLIRHLVEKGVDLYEVKLRQSDLEKQFIDLTNS